MQFNWWQTILAGIIIFGIGFGTRHFTYKSVKPAHGEIVRGTPVTSLLPEAPPLSGVTGSVVGAHNPTTDGELPMVLVDSLQSPLTVDYYYEQVTDTMLADSSHLYFRSRTYPYVENDSMKAFIVHEWNYQPRPATLIERVDTVYVMEEKEVPIYEKPAITIPIAFAAGIVTAIIIINNTRKDRNGKE